MIKDTVWLDDSAVPSQNSTDNITAKDVIGSKTDTTAGDSIIALLKQILADTTTINICETQPIIVERSEATLPETTQTPYFTVSGRVLTTQIVGEVTSENSSTATNIKLVANPTVGADVDMCVQVAIASDAVGTIYTITGTLTDAMIATTSGCVQAQLAAILVAAGTIDLYADATNIGKTKWTIHYIPLDSGSTVVAA